MPLLIIFAFLGGIVTILSPCILPILPIVLTGSVTGGKQRPWGVVMGFIASFTFFTLFLSAIVKATNVSADALRTLSVILIAGFGASLLVPAFQVMMEKILSRITQTLDSRFRGNDRKEGGNDNKNNHSDFLGGLLVGTSLGLLWTPCVGPILASIITLAAASQVTTDTIFITLAYATGTAIPLLAITYGGRSLLTKNPWLVANTGRIQKTFGILMILTAVGIYLQVDRKFQAFIIDRFPNYGTGLTKLEDTSPVRNALQQLQRKESSMETAPELIAGGEWFNSDSLSIKSLRGQVVLIDFWTYTCINCIRTLPYLKSWHAKYKDKGLVIIGVHTPEFEFEKNPDNVARAIADFGITYPVMQDNDYATWNAYANRYWPAKYLVDKNGKIRYTHFGEGEYDETEMKIQELLKEAGSLTDATPVDNPSYRVQARTPETYLGSLRGDYSRITTTGTWTVGEEYAMPSAGAKLSFRFDAAEVFLVMRPKAKGVQGNIRVLLDGTFVKDVNVDADKLYTLIELPAAGEHLLELEFLDGNVELYAFTFG
ncbi:cytochrome c biogenesis protein DipZ [Candidatus Gottesmanbacteria bacterium]|nr:cytochrome c biogenesis protein DipZ [Candidatus Gottesmanbacteria bacterium]